MTDELTIAELEEIERLNKARTQGRVRLSSSGYEVEMLLDEFDDNPTCMGEFNHPEDAAFYVAAASKMDKLLAAARRAMLPISNI